MYSIGRKMHEISSSFVKKSGINNPFLFVEMDQNSNKVFEIPVFDGENIFNLITIPRSAIQFFRIKFGFL